MSTCECGHEQTTPFCPECGRASAGPGNTLFEHIRQSLKRARSAQKTTNRLVKEGRVQTAHIACRQEENESRVAKWRGWAEWVRKAQVLEREAKGE